MADMNNNSGENDGRILIAPENMLHPKYWDAPTSDNAQTEGKGKNTVEDLSMEQVFNNASQGMGSAGPSVWGGPSDKKATQSSAEAGTKSGDGGNVDLTSGQNSCWNGGRAYKG